MGHKKLNMNITPRLIIQILFIAVLSTPVSASDIDKTDSLEIAGIATSFFDWYLTAIKEHRYVDFEPRFVENGTGMTTLNDSAYIKNLIRYKFSTTLIYKERQSYKTCIDNLKKTKYSDFKKTIFIDLDEYEKAQCDFGNYYRWIGGQVPIDGIRITGIESNGRGQVLVTIEYFTMNLKSNKRDYWGRNTLTMTKINHEWYIDKFDSWTD
jgi:hypothetical protein